MNSLRDSWSAGKEANTLCVKCKHCLDSNIYSSELISFKHNLAHLLAILERIHRWLRQQDLPAGGINFHLLVKRVVPQMLHIVPFLDDAILHGIADLQHGARGRRFVAAHDIFDYGGGIALFFAAEDGATNYGGVLEFGEVLPCRISIIVVMVVEREEGGFTWAA